MENVSISSLVSYAIGLLGIAFAAFSLKRQLREKSPKLYYVTIRDIELLDKNEDSPLKIEYKGNLVKCVFTTYIWIWNAGREPIRREDVPQDDRLRILFRSVDSDIQILDYAILKVTNNAISPRVKDVDSNILNIEFAFLDHKDGFVLEVKHTGERDSNPKILGTILGCSKGFDIKGRNDARASGLGHKTRLSNRGFWQRLRSAIKLVSAAIVLVGSSLVVLIGLVRLTGLVPKNMVEITENQLISILSSQEVKLNGDKVDAVMSMVEQVGRENAFYPLAALVILVVCILGLVFWIEMRKEHPFPDHLSIIDSENGINGT